MPRKEKTEEKQNEDITTELESTMKEDTTSPKIQRRDLMKNLQTNLEKIKSKQGIIGYILRAPKSASIDIKDPTKIIDYAVLSSTVLEAGDDLSNTFNIGKIYKVTLEGKEVKILSLKFGDHRLSVFMNKNVDQDEIYKDLNITQKQ